MATPGKKTVKKPKPKKVRRPSRARTARPAAKKRGKRSAKKAGKAAKKTVARKAAKKSSRKSARETRPGGRRSTTKQTGVTGNASAGKSAKPPIAKNKASRGAKSGSPAGRKSYYITTAIAYPNGLPHIGHAYEAIATDALARFQRLDGKEVFFLTGTDEHGLKMMQTAEAEKLPTMEVATRNAARFKDMDQRLNVSFDRFIRTTEEQHHRSSQEIWKRMAANGDIYLDS